MILDIEAVVWKGWSNVCIDRDFELVKYVVMLLCKNVSCHCWSRFALCFLGCFYKRTSVCL